MSIDKDYTPYIRAWQKRISTEKKRLDSLKRDRLILTEEVSQFLVERYGVEEVILFGSLVWGNGFRRDSDIDLAVKGMKKRDYIRALTDVESLIGVSVDITLLEELDGLIKGRIEREGRVIYHSEK